MNAPNLSPREQPAASLNTLQRLWRSLVQPSAALVELGERRQAELLASLTLIFLMLTGAGSFAGLVAVPGRGLATSSLMLLVTTGVTLVAYLLSRSRYFRLGAWLLIVVLVLGGFVTARGDPSRLSFALFSFLPFALIIASLFLSFASAAVVTALTVVALLALPLWVNATPRDTTLLAGSLGALGTLLLISAGFRNKLERERLAQLSAINEQLQTFGALLEQRVADRTRDLALAAEVGRSLAKARDLDSLLAEAVELIRERFDLYYARVYLLDAGGHNLVLQASSGPVDAELLRRRHRLPVGPGSLNGQAVLEVRPVLVSDTLADPNFKPDPLSPETRSQAAIPLIAEGRVLGVLDLQSTQPGAFTLESLPVFEMLAGQLAIGVENALLLKEAEAARTELAEQTRHLSRSGWQAFLGAIHRAEHFEHRYVAEDEAAEPTAPGKRSTLTMPVAVAGETIGMLHVEAGDRRSWSPEDVGLMEAVALEVAKQVDNLRLVAQAEQYRAEAEVAVRRMTREGWQEYLAVSPQPTAFVYDGQAVLSPLGATPAETTEPMRVQPLLLRGERLGEIAIEESAVGPEAEQIIAAVAEQLTAHLENLRLVAQAEQALAENQRRADQLARLSQMEQALSLATTEEEIVEAIRPAFGADDLVTLTLSYVTGDEQGGVQALETAALWAGGRFLPVPPTTRSDQLPLTPLWAAHPSEPTFIGDVSTDQRVTEAARAQAQREGWRSALWLPLRSGGQWQGLVAVTWAAARTLSADEAFFANRLMETVAGVTASRRAYLAQQQALAENMRRNQELAALNRIVTSAASTRDMTDLLQSAAKEVVQLLRARSAGFALLEPDGQHLRLVADHTTAQDEPSAVGTLIPVVGNLSNEWVFKHRRTLVVDDAQTNSLTAPIHHLLRQRRTQALLIMPLIVHGDIIGTLGVDLEEPGRTFTPAEIALVETLAGQLASALDNLHLYDEAQRRAERERLINTITQKIQGAASVSSALQTAIQELGLALKARRTHVVIRPSESLDDLPAANGH